VTVHQYDIVLDVTIINRTNGTLQNLCLELATMGDLKLVERPQNYTLGPGAQKTIRWAAALEALPLWQLPPPPKQHAHNASLWHALCRLHRSLGSMDAVVSRHRAPCHCLKCMPAGVPGFAAVAGGAEDSLGLVMH
jgi:Coatomer beta C-terminal region